MSGRPPKPRWVPRGPPPTTVPPLDDEAQWPSLVPLAAPNPDEPLPAPAQPEPPLPVEEPLPVTQAVASEDPPHLPEDIPSSAIASSSSSAEKVSEPGNASLSEKQVEVPPECKKNLHEEFEPTGPCHSPRQDSILMDIASSSEWKKPVVIRKVWNSNAKDEFNILTEIISKYPYVTVDTEFPGDIEPGSNYCRPLSPEEAYQHLRRNVNPTSLIQVGLTLTDADGNLPDLNTDSRYIWEINFIFDVFNDQSNPVSINMLKDAGLVFEEHLKRGVKTDALGELLMLSDLVLHRYVVTTWIVFHGDHDFAYLVKALTGRELPETLSAFLKLVDIFFGKVYAVKHMMAQVKRQGGLERIAKEMGLKRAAGRGHQAGSDSLLTWDMFWQFKKSRFPGVTGLAGMEEFAGHVYGLGKRDSNG